MEDDEDLFQQIDHRRMQYNIHRYLGQLRFVGHISDMYLSKIFSVASMVAGARSQGDLGNPGSGMPPSDAEIQEE